MVVLLFYCFTIQFLVLAIISIYPIETIFKCVNAPLLPIVSVGLSVFWSRKPLMIHSAHLLAFLALSFYSLIIFYCGV